MDKITIEPEQLQDDERGLLLIEIVNKINEMIDKINEG